MSNNIVGSFAGVPEMSNVELGGQHRSKAFVEFLRDVQQKEAAKLAAIVAPAQEAMRQMQRNQIDIWRRTPVEKIAKWSKSADKEFLSTLAPDINLPKYPEGFLDDKAQAKAAGTEANKLMNAFIASIPSRYGIVISRNDQTKFRHFIAAQVGTHDAAVTEDMLVTCFVWMVESEIFTDYGYDESLKTATPGPEPARLTLADAVKQADGTRSSDDRLRTAATNDFIFGEAAPMINKWINHLSTDYRYVPTDEQRLEFFAPPHGYFHQHGLSFLEGESYNRLRRWAVATGRFPPTMLTSGEVIDQRYKKGEMTWAEYNAALQSLTRRGLLNRPRAETGL